jgi:hypothetical protein
MNNQLLTVSSFLAVRRFAGLQVPQHHGNWTHHTEPAPSNIGKDVVIPELADTLEWVLGCPPNVHQFEEPPVSTFFAIRNVL